MPSSLAMSADCSKLICMPRSSLNCLLYTSKRFDKKLNAQDIINAIPGGVAIYKVSDIFETVYYSDGVPALSGYSRDEYDLRIKQDAADLIYQEDAAMVIRKIRQVLEAGKSASFEFRKQHRDGHKMCIRDRSVISARAIPTLFSR